MGLVVGGNYVRFLPIVVIFMGFGGVKRSGDTLKSSFRVAMQAARGGQFLWGRVVFTI